nr:acyl-coa ligase easd [Quercus suber]
MPFHPPSWTPTLPELPDSISVESFMFDEKYGRLPIAHSRAPFTCGLTGKTYSVPEVQQRVDHLSRALCKEFGFKPDHGSEWDKVIACFSLNTIDYLTLAWAMHRLGGILTCVNAAYNAHELEYQLKDSGAKGVFTCLPLLETAMAGAKKAGMPKEKMFLLDMAESITQGVSNPGLRNLDDLVSAGAKLDQQPRADTTWQKGDGAKKTAFLCYSSGTSGLPKGVMISHRNVIANTTQITAQESPCREKSRKEAGNPNYTENLLGLLPFSHIYGLIVICHVGAYRGDGVVVLPKYDFKGLLQVIQSHKIAMLYLVPPMIIHITKSREILKQYDLSSVRAIFTGAAPLGKETAEDLLALFPKWVIQQGYGLTETSTVVCSTSAFDVELGTSGSLLPGITARLVTPEGKEITEHNQPGELWVKGPAVVLGYLHNTQATRETFTDEADGRYMRTGDEAIVTRSAQGHEHITITDRIKELIKVKGLQVAPAELEAHLLTHPAVNDCVVIGVPADREGEVPKAFVVKAPGSIEESDALLRRLIMRHVAEHKSDHKRLRGGVEFIDVVPKSPSGKILRRLMRDQEKAKMQKAKAQAKL